MELDSIESVPSSDLTDEDEIHHHHLQFPSAPKAPSNNNNNININNSNSVSSAIQSISVHELLECPVCTNSMYPPIHQVCSLLQSVWWVLMCLDLFVSFVVRIFYCSICSVPVEDKCKFWNFLCVNRAQGYSFVVQRVDIVENWS